MNSAAAAASWWISVGLSLESAEVFSKVVLRKGFSLDWRSHALRRLQHELYLMQMDVCQR